MGDLTPKEQAQLARAACYESLDVFAAGAFSIINPGVQYKWNWHIDCICSPAGTKIQTPDGLRDIDDLVHSGYGGLVLSFNHQTQKPEWRRVLERMKSVGQPVYDLISCKGDKISLTGNHPVYANGEYTRADQVSVGASLLRVVPEALQASRDKAEQVLQSEVFCGETLQTCQSHMRRMWKSEDKQSGRSLQSLFRKILQEWQGLPLRWLRQISLYEPFALCHEFAQDGRLLQSKMFREACTRQEQHGVHRREISRAVPKNIQVNSQEDFGTRWPRLFSMWDRAKKASRSPSYRQEQRKQRGLEPSFCMPFLSQQAEGRAGENIGVGECVISSITKSLRIPDAVYNIEVEGNNNYFAGGILVHNCEYLQACYRGEIRRLIINMPPRALKSYLVSELFGAWVLGREPHEQFIVASHTMRPLAVKLSNDTRRLMESEWYLSMFPDTKIDKSTENQLVTTKNGHRLAVSVGTGITGLGFNYGILDDPNKPDEALSDVIRVGTNDWIDNTFMSRMNDRLTGRIICVMQRVHEDDATGHLLEKGGYTHLKLPAEAPKPVYYKIDGKQFGMKTGDLLHEARLPPDVLEELRRDLGDYSYSGQYMQEPVPIGGGMFKTEWVQYFSLKDFEFKNMNVYILCDPAGVGDVPGANRRKKSDWTAFQVVGLANDNNYYLLDMVRDKFNPTERVQALFDLHRKWNDLTGKSPKVGYESYGLQSDLHYIMQKQTEDSYRFPLIPLGGSMSKPDRIARLIPDMQNRRWYFPAKIDYTDTRGMRYDLVSEMIKGEMSTFPVSKHDDCIDALSRIYDEDMQARFPKRVYDRRVLPGFETSAPKPKHWINL